MGGYYYNTTFDEKLIFHDENYCTIDSFHIQNSLQIFVDLQKRFSFVNVTDIGYGQGEFVKPLAKLGVNAFGYDPVLKKPEDNLSREYFNPLSHTKSDTQDVYVLRCVLPHISNPWAFIDSILEINSHARFYVEFQRLEWILENKVWQQISHDHVNLFSILDFQGHYRILECGSYSSGECGYVLFEQSAFKDLFEVRRRQIEEVANVDGPLLVYGGAGKGIVFSYAIQVAGKQDIYVIDADSNHQNKYLECSGVKVFSSEEILNVLSFDATVIVMNKNHINYARRALVAFSKVCSLSDYKV